ncbi:MAG: universal stress protein [Pseudolabrys sp.]|nr:universal stress protein [Pseudolabrys sp.]MDP2297059.1 universal stress protein [Pseudolabrys sp.]
MRQIVAATDFSTRSQRALRRAGLLARQTTAELTLVHVVDDDQPEALVDVEQREANKFLNEQIGSLAELRDVRCRAVVTTGEAFDAILRTAKSASADLIVMGSHRKQILRDIFIGTTIERVIRTGPYPVLMVNTDTEHPYRHVIAGVDLSEPSTHAIKTAKVLDLVNDSNLTVVHAFIAVAKGKLYAANAPQDQIEGYVARERMQASEELFSFLKAQGLGGARWSYRIVEGGAFEVISRVAKETVADLVVIGTHGRSGIVKMLVGSVAEEVLRGLDIDILAVPPIR